MTHVLRNVLALLIVVLMTGGLVMPTPCAEKTVSTSSEQSIESVSSDTTQKSHGKSASHAQKEMHCCVAHHHCCTPATLGHGPLIGQTMAYAKVTRIIIPVEPRDLTHPNSLERPPKTFA